MKKKYWLMLAVSFFYLSNLHAVNLHPHCPKVPLTASIGDHLPQGWKIWKTYEMYSWWKGFKYKYFKDTYEIQKWDEAFEGYFSISPKQTRYYIACCKHKKNRDFFLCAMKEMDAVYFCESPLIQHGNEKAVFDCIPWKSFNQGIG